VPQAQRQNSLVRVRSVPGARDGEIGKRNHNEISVPLAFAYLGPSAVHDETAAKRLKCGVDAIEVFDDISAQFDVIQVGNSICSHGGSVALTR
jgi:hypothetical protein